MSQKTVLALIAAVVSIFCLASVSDALIVKIEARTGGIAFTKSVVYDAENKIMCITTMGPGGVASVQQFPGHSETEMPAYANLYDSAGKLIATNYYDKAGKLRAYTFFKMSSAYLSSLPKLQAVTGGWPAAVAKSYGRDGALLRTTKFDAYGNISSITVHIVSRESELPTKTNYYNAKGGLIAVNNYSSGRLTSYTVNYPSAGYVATIPRLKSLIPPPFPGTTKSYGQDGALLRTITFTSNGTIAQTIVYNAARANELPGRVEFYNSSGSLYAINYYNKYGQLLSSSNYVTKAAVGAVTGETATKTALNADLEGKVGVESAIANNKTAIPAGVKVVATLPLKDPKKAAAGTK